MRRRIIISIKKRLKEEISVRNPLKYLLVLDVEEYIDTLISVLYLYTRPKKGAKNEPTYLTETICALGHNLRSRYKLHKDSSLAAKTGAFFLYSFEEAGILHVIKGQGSNGHAVFIIKIIKEDVMAKLWEGLPTRSIQKLPSELPHTSWTSTKHSSGLRMVKTANPYVLETITPETHPLLFEGLNRAQEVKWQINKDIYKLHIWALQNKTDAFADIWELNNPQARATKEREAKAIGGIAKRFLNKTFSHLYYYDFRGRRYPTTAYLHEQGSDLARGLLLRGDKKPIGFQGYSWLLIAIASTWAGDAGRFDGLKTDKIPFEERVQWAYNNEDTFLSYAEDPKKNQGWMRADKPWQFIAACFELYKLRVWQATSNKGGPDFENYDYPSSLEVYIDGSNNGSQHLAALTRDEITAPHVNLTPSEYPGDLYKYIAEFVWDKLEQIVAETPVELQKKINEYIDTLMGLKKGISAEPIGSENRKALIEDIRRFKSYNEELGKMAAPFFWNRITDSKERRKIVKRNVMTLPYGGTPFGLSRLK